MKYHRQHDWFPVLGELVQIRNTGKILSYGVVDAVTKDDSILWLAADGVNPRQMVCRSEGNEVWITYKWDTTGPAPCHLSPEPDCPPTHHAPLPSSERKTCL
ncbi:hypothetical protein J2Y66_003795 [Paenarthrobacter nitroguajacolicus]|nr:hypothetical protein [Paenarthrobacter nitroguajacolicus]